MTMTEDQHVLEALYNIVSESKQEMYDRIAGDRTRHICVVLENIRKAHNASAVMRTCDCIGIQDIHTIEKNTEYVVQREIAKGASTWVNQYTYTEGETPSADCILSLKQKGYKIVATSPHADKGLFQVPIDQPMALLFGTEQHGVSEEAIDLADEFVSIPMYGFTESLNVSVCAAIMLNTLRARLESSTVNWRLSEGDQTALKIEWCAKIIRDGNKVVDEIRKRIRANDY